MPLTVLHLYPKTKKLPSFSDLCEQSSFTCLATISKKHTYLYLWLLTGRETEPLPLPSASPLSHTISIIVAGRYARRNSQTRNPVSLIIFRHLLTFWLIVTQVDSKTLFLRVPAPNCVHPIIGFRILKGAVDFLFCEFDSL